MGLGGLVGSAELQHHVEEQHDELERDENRVGDVQDVTQLLGEQGGKRRGQVDLQPLGREGPHADAHGEQGRTGGAAGHHEEHGQNRRVPERTGLHAGKQDARVDRDAQAEDAGNAEQHLCKTLIRDEGQEREPGKLPEDEEHARNHRDGEKHSTPLDDRGPRHERAVENPRLTKLEDEQAGADAQDEEGDEDAPHEGTARQSGWRDDQSDNGGGRHHAATKAAQEEVEGNRPNPELLHCTVPPKSGM